MPRRINTTIEEFQAAIFSSLHRCGAWPLRCYEEDCYAVAEFKLDKRHIRLAAEMPAFDLFLHSPSGRRRIKRLPIAEEEFEYHRRQAWKALTFLTKGKVYAVHFGARSFDQEFSKEEVIGEDP